MYIVSFAQLLFAMQSSGDKTGSVDLRNIDTMSDKTALVVLGACAFLGLFCLMLVLVCTTACDLLLNESYMETYGEGSIFICVLN
jgi:hypothetical protein